MGVTTEIVKAAKSELNRVYPDVDVYTSEIEQGFNEPCFFIAYLNGSEKQVVNNRYFRNNLFDIQYFPKNDSDKNDNIWDMSEDLKHVLEYITLEDGTTLRGTSRREEIQEGILHFFVNYNTHIYKDAGEKNYMEKLDKKVDLREE